VITELGERKGDHSPRWAAAPERIVIITEFMKYLKKHFLRILINDFNSLNSSGLLNTVKE
jgi:hypothetical protein